MSYQHLKQSDRDEISILLKKGYSHRDIAGSTGKDHSSVSREIKRNSVKGIYNPRKAQAKARTKRLHSKYQGMKIRNTDGLEKYLEKKLKKHWTPEQIAGRLKQKNGETVISAKSIYEYLYSEYGQHLCRYLPGKRYSPVKKGVAGSKREIIKNRVFIENRPDIVNERARFGDFEGDTLGRIKTDEEAVAGMVERMSRFFLIEKVSRLKYAMDGFKRLLNPYQNITQSVTLDNGVENKNFSKLNVDTYFCHPYHSWEKGQIENTFGRLRRFIPKKKSLKHYSPKKISAIMNIMNDTPRKCLGFRTPTEVFKEQLALISNQQGVALGGKM